MIITWQKHGFICQAGFSKIKVWVGYVILPENHPWYGLEYDSLDIDCHGGITFSNAFEADGWRIGFDCAHLGDLIPPKEIDAFDLFPVIRNPETMALIRNLEMIERATYRDVLFVTEETEKLAEQAKRVEKCL